jgi:hypothetical protein
LPQRRGRAIAAKGRTHPTAAGRTHPTAVFRWGDHLANAEEVVSQLEDQLKQAEATQQRDALEAALARLEERDAALAARSEAIQAALDNNDVAALAELMGDELMED